MISTIESFDKGKIGVHEIDVFALNKDGIRITNASVSVYWQIIEWHSNINVLGQFNRTEADMLKEFVFDYRESIYPFDNTRNNGDGFQGRADYIAKEALLPITGSRSYDHTNEEIIIYSHKNVEQVFQEIMGNKNHVSLIETKSMYDVASSVFEGVNGVKVWVLYFRGV